MVDIKRLWGTTNSRLALCGSALLAVLAIAYVVDLASSHGEVPRGVVVAGVTLGGMDTAAAEDALRSALLPRSEEPVQVRAGDVTSTVDPRAAGLAVDWPATMARVGAQPLNPFTRVSSLFGTRDVSVTSTSDPVALDKAVEALRPKVDRAPVEGTVTFTELAPTVTQPVAGQTLNVRAAATKLLDGWVVPGVVELPVQRQQATVTAEGLDAALASARIAVSADVLVQGKGAAARLTPAELVGVLGFVPAGGGGLRPQIDTEALTRMLAPQLAATQTKATDATVAMREGAPQVVPAVDGLTVDWPATTTGVTAAATGTQRSVDASYRVTPATVSTAQAEALGIKEVIGEFTTGGFSYASGVNIRQVAKQVDGAVVKPGGSFSLNGYTGPRGSAQGYVESGIIQDGHAGTAVGGGISQFATTLYNASYFAGLTDVDHREHSYYISRYPAAREATVYEGAIDLVFSVPTKTGILIEAIGTDSSITVRIWGTKTVAVESIPGGRSNFTSPKEISLPKGKDCAVSKGAGGFTTSDTRVIRDLAGQEISRRTRTVRYDPQPIVRCV